MEKVRPENLRTRRIFSWLQYKDFLEHKHHWPWRKRWIYFAILRVSLHQKIWNQILSTSYRRVLFNSQNVLKNIFELHAHIIKVDLFQIKIWIFSLLSKNGGWYGNAGPTIPTIPRGNRSCRARPLCLRHVLSNSQQPQLVLFYKICLVLQSIRLSISSIQQTQKSLSNS